MSQIDPAQMAQQLATYEVQPFQKRYTTQTTSYKDQLSAFGKVESALREFQSSVKAMNGFDTSVVKTSAEVSQDGFVSATTNAKALKGQYQVFVEQVAVAHQVSTSMPTSITSESEVPKTGTLDFTVNGETLSIDLATIDSDSDGKHTIEELIKSINNAKDNPGVSATLIRSGGETRLMLASTETGVANQINVSATTGESWFDNAFGALTTISAAKDAKIWLGAESTGLALESSSNTFKGIIDGVDLTVTKAQKSGEQPISLKIDADKEGSKEQVNKLVDAYNKLISEIDTHTKIGSKDEKRGALASDATVRSLKERLSSLFRTEFGGQNLTQLGFTFDRSGKLSLDSKRFESALENNSAQLETVLNGDGNLFDTIESQLKPYLAYSSGLFSSKKESIQGSIDRLEDKQTGLQRKYDIAYKRYLKQFTQMNNLMSQMNQTRGLFV